MRHVVFTTASERYALPLASVREVVVPAPLSRVPRSPPAICGIMNLRGRVVTVVDLAVLFGLADPPDPIGGAPEGMVVLLERGRRDLGLLVGNVEGIHTVEQVAPAPGAAMPAVRGVARAQAGPVTVLDADGLDAQVAGLFGPNVAGFE